MMPRQIPLSKGNHERTYFVKGQGKSLLATVRLDCTIQAKTIQYTIWHFALIIHMHTVLKEQLRIKASYID